MASNKERVEEAQQQLEEHVAQLAGSDEWKAWLDTLAKFHNYSLNNQLLIHLQRPDATLVAGVKRWNAMGRKVMKGEKGNLILAPCKYRAREDDGDAERDAKDPKMVVRGFRGVYVFDVSQTDGVPLAEPPRPRLLDGDVPEGVWDALVEQAESDGWSFGVEDIPEQAGGRPNGFTSFVEHRIVVGEHCPPQQRVKTLAHEIAHKQLHEKVSVEDRHRGVHEVEAESVAYVVMQGVGIDSAEYSGAYLLGWSGGDAAVVRQTAENVRRVSHDVLTDVYERVPELDPAQVEQEAVTRQQAKDDRTLAVTA